METPGPHLLGSPIAGTAQALRHTVNCSQKSEVGDGRTLQLQLSSVHSIHQSPSPELGVNSHRRGSNLPDFAKKQGPSLSLPSESWWHLRSVCDPSRVSACCTPTPCFFSQTKKCMKLLFYLDFGGCREERHKLHFWNLGVTGDPPSHSHMPGGGSNLGHTA